MLFVSPAVQILVDTGLLISISATVNGGEKPLQRLSLRAVMRNRATGEGFGAVTSQPQLLVPVTLVTAVAMLVKLTPSLAKAMSTPSLPAPDEIQTSVLLVPRRHAVELSGVMNPIPAMT